MVERWRRWMVPELGEGAARLDGLRGELEKLPEGPGEPDYSSTGYRSAPEAMDTAEKWVQVDLGQVMMVDDIVLMPAVVPSASGEPVVVGFPLRFRVEMSEDLDFGRREVVFERTAADFPAPGPVPVMIRGVGLRGRHVRVTAVKLGGEPDNHFLALGELVVCSGGRNVADGAQVQARDMLGSPRWSLRGLADGISVLGRPTEIRRFPTNGYHGATEGAGGEQWVQVDLGEEKVIESVVLIPARPGDMADTIGYGFPVRFRVEASVDEGFREVVAIGGSGGGDYPNPGDRRVVLGAGGVRGRYVRVTAEKLWVGPGNWEAGDGVFALAEMEVNAGGRNAALGGGVTASGQLEGKMERWAPAFLVDGVAPPEGMGTYADWLAAMARKYEIVKEAGLLERRPWELREEADWRLGWLGSGMAGMLVVAGVAGWWSGLVRERRRTQQLRAGIARDLHDEIGSNLSSIGLLSELAIGAAPDAEAMQMELEDIRRVALQTADSMHDIVWLIGPGQKTMGDLSARMRETAGLMLAGMEWTVEAPDGGGAERLSLGAQRDVYLFFKEALHNIRRHAGATRVRIQLVRRGRTMELTVEDNGRGFDPERKSTGHGLANMKQRAEACRGSLVIGAGNGSGARLVFTIPCGG